MVAKVVLIGVEKLQPNKINAKYFKDLPAEEYSAFLTSVNTEGILNPLIVNKIAEDRYTIVCGHQRYKAAIDLGFTEVPCFVRELDETQELKMLIQDNVFRRQLNHLEKARAIAALKRLNTCTKKICEISGLNNAKIGRYNTIGTKLIDELYELIPEDVPLDLLLKISVLPNEMQKNIADLILLTDSKQIKDVVAESYQSVINTLQKKIKKQEEEIQDVLVKAEGKNPETRVALEHSIERACYDDVLRTLLNINTQIINLFEMLATHNIDPKLLGFHDFNYEIKEFANISSRCIPPVTPIFRLINSKTLLEQFTEIEGRDIQQQSREIIDDYLLKIFGHRA